MPLGQKANRPLWIHLMVDNPESWVEKLQISVGNLVSFHIESTREPLSIINALQKKKLLSSIALSPKTDVATTFPFLDVIDQILIMSVEPGFSGQQFMPAMMNKVDRLVEYRNAHKLNFRIGMDGGISRENIKMVVDRGVDDFGVAHAIFGKRDPIKALIEFKNLVGQKGG